MMDRWICLEWFDACTSNRWIWALDRIRSERTDSSRLTEVPNGKKTMNRQPQLCRSTCAVIQWCQFVFSLWCLWVWLFWFLCVFGLGYICEYIHLYICWPYIYLYLIPRSMYCAVWVSRVAVFAGFIPGSLCLRVWLSATSKGWLCFSIVSFLISRCEPALANLNLTLSYWNTWFLIPGFKVTKQCRAQAKHCAN